MSITVLNAMRELAKLGGDGTMVMIQRSQVRHDDGTESAQWIVNVWPTGRTIAGVYHDGTLQQAYEEAKKNLSGGGEEHCPSCKGTGVKREEGAPV